MSAPDRRIDRLIRAYREAEGELRAANNASERARRAALDADQRASDAWAATSKAREVLLDAIRGEQ